MRSSDPASKDELLAALYGELRRLAGQRMAHERVGHTLTATALVHEAYLRIAGDRADGWKSKAQFFAAAAEAMRRILIEKARERGRARRGGDRARLPLTGLDLADDHDPSQVQALDEAVTRLEADDPRAAQVVKLRIYAGLGEEEIAAALEVSTRAVRRDWQYARAWLFAALREAE